MTFDRWFDTVYMPSLAYSNITDEEITAAASAARAAWDAAREHSPLDGVVRAITNANPDKHYDNLGRRILKLSEELGEASQAYLNVTSPSNGKNKTWGDVREELADTVIVAVDCALTPTPDQVLAGFTRAEVEEAFAAEIETKLAKWARNRATGIVATDAE